MACRPEIKTCFNCFKQFNENNAVYCDTCTEWECSECGACGCDVSPSTLKAIRAIVKTYEDWLAKGGQ
jgi:hypothetical protein